MRKPKPLGLIVRGIALIFILGVFYYVACGILRVAGAL